MHHLDKGITIVENQLSRRKQVYDELVSVWEKTRLPKGLSTEDKTFFFQQDRARHFANRTPDLSYHIYDEQLLNLEGYLDKLRQYRDFFYTTIVKPEAPYIK